MQHVLSREQQDVPAAVRTAGCGEARPLAARARGARAHRARLRLGPAGLIADGDGNPCHARRAGGADPRRALHAGRRAGTGAPRPVPADAPAFATATITYDGKTITVPLAEGEAILDGGERAGLVLPWSCRGGMCSTCRARLVEGEVTMEQNFALEPWETEAGFVLTCQSHPVGHHVAVDYDHV